MTHPAPLKKRVCVAVIGAPNGVRGAVRVKPYTEDPLTIRDYSPLMSEDGTRAFEVLSARVQGEMLIVTFKGITDRNTADTLKHMKLYVDRERLPALDNDADAEDFYHADLIGLDVDAEDGTRLGRVMAVLNFGAGDLLDIRREGEGRNVLMPFTRAFVPVVDLAARRIVAAPPAGLFDDTGDDKPDDGDGVP